MRKSDSRMSLDELVAAANQMLPQLLPQEQRSSRQSESVNRRLVRNLSTLGLIDDALREGREARYLYRHLLQLLASRVLMAKGYTTGAVKQLIAGVGDDELELILQGDLNLTVAAVSGSSTGPSIVKRRNERQEAERDFSPLPSEAATNSALEFLRKVQAKGTTLESGQGRLYSSPSGAAPPLLSTPSSDSSNYVRVEVRPGLELHIGEEFQLPPSRYEREVLTEEMLDALKVAAGRKKKR